MNNARRKKINKVIDTLSACKDIIEELRDEEEDTLNNIPENLQSSERYMNCEMATDSLNEAVDQFDNIESEIEELINMLENAAM